MGFTIVDADGNQIKSFNNLNAAVTWGISNNVPGSAGKTWAVFNTDDLVVQVFPPIIGLTQLEDLT